MGLSALTCYKMVKDRQAWRSLVSPTLSHEDGRREEISGCGHNQNYAKLGHKCRRRDHVILHSVVSLSSCSVRGAYDVIMKLKMNCELGLPYVK